MLKILSRYKLEIFYGMIFSGMMILWPGLEKIFGLHGKFISLHAYLTNLFAIPALFIYYQALRQKRKVQYHEKMTWLDGFYTGLRLTAVVFLLNPLVQITVSKIISPDFFRNMIAHLVDKGRITLDAAENIYNTRNYILQGLLGAPVMGVITSALVSFILWLRR